PEVVTFPLPQRMRGELRGRQPRRLVPVRPQHPHRRRRADEGVVEIEDVDGTTHGVHGGHGGGIYLFEALPVGRSYPSDGRRWMVEGRQDKGSTSDIIPHPLYHPPSTNHRLFLH